MIQTFLHGGVYYQVYPSKKVPSKKDGQLFSPNPRNGVGLCREKNLYDLYTVF